MRAVTYAEYGDPSVLKVEDVPEPHAGPGQVRIRVRAASVNPVDWKLRAGFLQQMMPMQLPAVPGRDGAGVVDEVGEGVTGTAVGDRVFGLSTTGTAAEHAVLGAWAQMPDTWTFAQAAAAGVAGETAIRVLDLLGVGAGTTLLIEGAAGGVGSAAAQIGVARGATVIGTASEANHAFLRTLGALPTTYGPGLADRVGALAPNGVDVVFDAVGSGSLPDLVKIAPSAADVVTIADPTAAEHGARFAAGGADATPALVEAATLGAAGRYLPHVSGSYPLDQLGEAHANSQAGHVQGKLLIEI
jgi:NADPH:quinone reductase-like Zn-dependent oxidoreductase